MTKALPEQLYVVSKEVIERSYEYDNEKEGLVISNEEKINFGFLHPHQPNLVADTKRKRTQHEWAYTNLTEKDGVFYEQVYKRDQFGRIDYKLGTELKKIDPQYAPRVIDNDPIDGFEIIDTVNRFRGNKLFKVKDPRGYVFELTVASLFEIIQKGTIQKGIIMNKCAWKANKNLVIVE